VNELLFKKYFGTRPVTPLHNLYPSKPILVESKLDGWLAKCLSYVDMLYPLSLILSTCFWYF